MGGLCTVGIVLWTPRSPSRIPEHESVRIQCVGHRHILWRDSYGTALCVFHLFRPRPILQLQENNCHRVLIFLVSAYCAAST